tara:strand:- start:220 stop:558 length:339 start_codon:yes stop_codon:yes gene_type:complete
MFRGETMAETDPFQEPPAIKTMYAEFMDHRKQTIQAISHMMAQINRLNTIIFATLQDLDLVEELICPKCGPEDGPILRPMLNNLPSDRNDCPMCGYDFNEDQTGLDDFSEQE